jgi:hypothetical protein
MVNGDGPARALILAAPDGRRIARAADVRRPTDDGPHKAQHFGIEYGGNRSPGRPLEVTMALSKTENKQFGDRCLPFVVKSVASDFGLDFHVCPRQMSASPTMGLHITAHRHTDAKLSYPLNVFVYWQPAGVRQFLTHIDRPIAAARASERIPEEIRKVMGQSGIDFAGRSQAKGEVLLVELNDMAM